MSLPATVLWLPRLFWGSNLKARKHMNHTRQTLLNPEDLTAILSECQAQTLPEGYVYPVNPEIDPDGKPILTAEQIAASAVNASRTYVKALHDMLGPSSSYTTELGRNTAPLQHKAIQPKNEITFLNVAHRRVIQLAATGMSVKEIASTLKTEGVNLAKVTIQTIINSPMGKAEVERIVREADGGLLENFRVSASLAQKALTVLANATDGFVRYTIPGDANGPETTMVKPINPDQVVRAAITLLDRFPQTAPVQKQAPVDERDGLLSTKLLATLKERVEAARSSSIPVQASEVVNG